MQVKRLAPILIFAYNRPQHLHNLLYSLEKCPEFAESSLNIFVDGPRCKGQEKNINSVRKLVENYPHPHLTHYISEKNKGLANSIIEGVSQLLLESKSAIILEDDLVASPFLLKYLNDGLELYESEPKVASIHAYIHAMKGNLPETFFLRGADCWGWATWQRAWSSFEPDGKKLLRELENRNLLKDFDLDGAYSFSGMLKDQIAGKNDSWAIRWHASTFLKKMLTLYPRASLVANTGNDGSGTNCKNEGMYNVKLAARSVLMSKIPIEESKEARDCLKMFFKHNKPSFIKRLALKARNFCGAGHALLNF